MYEMEGPRLAPRPWSPDCSGAERLAATTGVRLRCQHRSPGPSRVALGFPWADPVFSGEEFLLPTAPVAQGFSVISSRFFCRPQDIYRLSPVHGSFPLNCAQVRPQLLWITGGRLGRPARPPWTALACD